MRAEALAQPIFFAQRTRWEDWVFAQFPVSTELAHGVALDTATHAAYCTCPFLPKPCIHARAFSLLFARAGAADFEPMEGALPDWVAAFAPSCLPGVGEKQGAPKQQAPAPQPDRTERLERAAHGFEDLELWLLDTLRRGMATALSEDPDFYKSIAARLADASMRSLSRSIRTLEAVPADRPDWPDRITAVLANAALALYAFRRREHLPEALLHDLEIFIGFSPKKETVRAAGEVVHDTWMVVGAVEEPVEDQLRQRRTWLQGVHTGRYALLQEYAHGQLDFMPGFAPGSVLQGEMIFYPSAWPHRALAADALKLLPGKVENLAGYEKIEDMARSFAAALGKQPWLPAFPAALNLVTPVHHKNRFGLADTAGKYLPLGDIEAANWSLLALGGGRPVTVFGEWNSEAFRVLSALADHRFVSF